MARYKDRLGTLVFKDVESKEILIWKHIESEVVQDYRYLKEGLLDLGYTIQSVTLDGKRVLYKAFKDTPLQMCLSSKENYTTNALEGGVFSHMKNMISLHRELSKSMKLNILWIVLFS